MNFNIKLLFKLKEYKSFDDLKHCIQPNNWLNEQYIQLILENLNICKFILNDKIKNLNNSSYKFIDIKYSTFNGLYRYGTFNTVFENIKKI